MPAPDAPQGGGGGAPGGLGNPLLFLIPILLLFILMPLLTGKKEKQRRLRLAGLKKHDKVVTNGGLFGVVTAIDNDSVTLEVANDVRLRFRRSAVYDLEGAEAPAPGAAPARK